VSSLPVTVATFLEGDERAERCPADPDYAAVVLDDVVAEECEDMLHAAAQGRWRKANTYSYDAARKSIEAWLLANGWRIRSTAGAHAAVVSVADVWLGRGEAPGPRIARSYGASRKARHDDECPSPNAMTRSDRELRALVLDNARLINLVREQMGKQGDPAILPTEERLEQRPER
jgi:hypothetical protein